LKDEDYISAEVEINRLKARGAISCKFIIDEHVGTAHEVGAIAPGGDDVDGINIRAEYLRWCSGGHVQ
jgi:hypothetical protein